MRAGGGHDRRDQRRLGDVVEAGQQLVCVEAMKMEMWLTARTAGTWPACTWNCKQSVEAGAVLVVIDPAGDGLMDKAIITCALTGVLTNPKQHPVPVTPAQMAAEARDAFNAGRPRCTCTCDVRKTVQATCRVGTPTWRIPS